MTHPRQVSIPLETPVRKPNAEELRKGQTIYYPVKSRTSGEEAKITKYRPARLRKVAFPVVHIEWLDEKPSKDRHTETLFLNEVVVPDGPAVSLKRPLRFSFDTPDVKYEEEDVMPRQPIKSAQVRSIAPLMGVARDQQQLNHTSAAAANFMEMEEKGEAAFAGQTDTIPAPPEPTTPPTLKRNATDSFDEWVKMGSEIVFADIDRDINELDAKVEQIDRKLAELNRNHNEYVKELEEQLIRAKQEHQQDTKHLEARLRNYQEEKQRFEKRKLIMAEVRKLL